MTYVADDYAITPESVEHIRQRIASASDAHLVSMIGTALLLLRNKKANADAVEISRAAGLDEMTVDRATEYNTHIMTLLIEELNQRVKGTVQ